MSQVCLPETEVRSLYEAALREACRHRWIESQKHGHDLGEHGLIDWYERYWWNFLRYRHLEHLLGECLWEEFETDSFAVLAPVVESRDELAIEIVDLYRQGCENLDIVNWALREELPMHQVRRCLILINMNDARIDPQFN